MNQERLGELKDLAARLEGLQRAMRVILDAERSDVQDGQAAPAVVVLAAALGQVETAVASLDSLSSGADANQRSPDDDELNAEMMDAPGG